MEARLKQFSLGSAPVSSVAFWYLNSPSLALRETPNCLYCWAKTGPRKRGTYRRDEINRKGADMIVKIHRTSKWALAVIFTVLLNFLRGEQNVNCETRQRGLDPRRFFILECFELNRIALGNIYHKGISLCWQMGTCVCDVLGVGVVKRAIPPTLVVSESLLFWIYKFSTFLIYNIPT